MFDGYKGCKHEMCTLLRQNSSSTKRHWDEKVGRKWSYSSSFPFGKFQQGGSRWRYVHSNLNVPLHTQTNTI